MLYFFFSQMGPGGALWALLWAHNFFWNFLVKNCQKLRCFDIFLKMLNLKNILHRNKVLINITIKTVNNLNSK